MVATGGQMVPAIIILSGLYFTPNSPRWLISKNRRSDALSALKVFRPKKAADEGLCELEIIALENSDNRSDKAPWKALFNGSNRRRTAIALAIMSLQQLTGVTFSSSYGTTFYKQVGLGDKAFAYAVRSFLYPLLHKINLTKTIQAINNGVSVVTAMIGMYMFDVFGRRDLTFHGCYLQALFLCLIGGLGAKANRSTSDTNGMVASFILYAAILHATLGPAAYITAAEVCTATLREKMMAVSVRTYLCHFSPFHKTCTNQRLCRWKQTAWNVVVGFAVVYTTPYLLSTPGANLGARLGYVWGGCAAVGAVWAWFFMPELKGRSLEDIDELFDAGLPAWKFKQYECTGINREVLEGYRGR
jgi:hypothetical protein